MYECLKEKRGKEMYNKHLDTFVKVADLGSFSKAAEELYISPTAVIKQINLLENHLGITLFKRTHQGIALTNAGKSLYHDAQYMINYSRISIARAKKEEIDQRTTIRVGSSLITPSHILSRLWPEAQKYCPDLDFRIVPYENTIESTNDIFENFGRDIDVTVGLFDLRMLEYRKCSALRIDNIPLMCAVPQGNELYEKEKLSIKDLYGQNLMLVKQGGFQYFDILRADIISNHSQINIVDFDHFNIMAFNQCVQKKCPIVAIEPWSGIHPLLRYIPVDWEYSSPYGILYAREPSPNVAKFIRAMEKILDGNDFLLC